MNKKLVSFVVAIFCYSVVLGGIFCFIGYKIAYGGIENSAPSRIPQTFYATITDIQDNSIKVKGMEINDINFRGEFCFFIVEETKITWRYTDILIDDLDVGDNISITFTGEILETYPGQIQQVETVQLLDDEK